MLCENCGSDIPKYAKYCEQCGIPVKPTLQMDTPERKTKSSTIWMIGGIAAGISFAAIIVVFLFASGIIGGKDNVTPTKTDKKEDTGIAQVSQQPTVTPSTVVTTTPAPKPTVKKNPVKNWDADISSHMPEKDNAKTGEAAADKLTVGSVVQHARDIYYGTNKKLKSYSVSKADKEYIDYYDNKNNILRKAITYPTSKSDGYIKGYTAEYYYDDEQKLVFAFAYKKIKGKAREYRAYYGTDGKLYRYIDASGRISDYNNGMIISSSSKLKYELYHKGTLYLHLALD